MVERLIKSSPVWSVVLFLVMCAAAIVVVLQRPEAPPPAGVALAQGGGGPAIGGEVPTMAEAWDLAGDYAPTVCVNSTGSPTPCGVGSGGDSAAGPFRMPSAANPTGRSCGACGSGFGFLGPPTRSSGFSFTSVGDLGERPIILKDVLARGNSLIDGQSLNYIRHSTPCCWNRRRRTASTSTWPTPPTRR
jgi:hypothetical protein